MSETSGPRLAVGLNIVPVPPDRLVDVAQAAEELGFESLWSGEHVALPVERYWEGYAGDPGPEGVPFTPDTVFLEPLILLAHLAAATTRVRLGVGIYLLALRDAILAARAITTLDVLSSGRLDLGVGLGWTPREYEFTNNEWVTRGRRMDEIIDAITCLFTEDHPEFHGEFFDFPKIGFRPKPVQSPRPKFHIGGYGAPAKRRAIARGDGWYGSSGSNPDDAAATIAELRAGLEAAGRGDVPFEFSSIAIRGRPTRESLDALGDVGWTRVVVTPWSGRRMHEAQHDPIGPLESYAREIGLTATRPAQKAP